MISTHQLPASALAELSVGHGDRSVTNRLRAAQHSKHLWLLQELGKDVARTGERSPDIDAFRSGLDLLAKVQAEHPDEVARLISLPQVGAWLHDCITCLERGTVPDYGYLAVVAATAALGAGVGFELDIPVHGGELRLPGLGGLDIAPAGRLRAAGSEVAAENAASSVRLSSNGEHLTVGQFPPLRCDSLHPAVPGEPDDRTNTPTGARWASTPLIRATAAGHAWEVLVEASERHFGLFPFPPVAALTAGELGRWQDGIRAAWAVLARQKIWELDAFADVVSVIVPVAEADDVDLVSVTSPAAFGAIATSWSPDPVDLAEMLIHEYQHLKLSALLDVVPLISQGGGQALGYAAWRPDPRPASGLLQGMYAHLAVARFWDIQRGLEDDPDDRFRAQVLFERWRSTIESTADTLLAMNGCLTSEGTRFVEALKSQGQMLESGSVPAGVQELAEEVALDHWLTWQVRHIELDTDGIARAAAAFLGGGQPDREILTAGKVAAYTRQVDSTTRSQMLSLRQCQPKRFRQLRATGALALGQADMLLIEGSAAKAFEAYREEILTSADPMPQSWVGLALAASRTASAPLRAAFATRLPLMFEVHCYLTSQGVPSDPLDLAAWLS